ncbi:TetR family transcriptional regulator [Anthocerotibacter panamensis]|uniref:TetR family transcriptional regulator n=1 Tax=Anthocerotibacter panamensis TaxID=2857077 RepID=UPI001C401F52|nr:TetR family transcriptional regulator [Anthocerotibacter panamensis]
MPSTAQKKTSSTRPSRDAEATKAAILAAAEKEFAQQGLEATRTEDIAARTGVTKAMIYYYFKSKEDLYVAVLERVFAHAFSALNDLKQHHLPPEEALETFLREVLKFSCHNTNLAMLMFLEGMQNKGKYYERAGIPGIYKALSEILAEGIAAGVFRPLDPLHTAVNIFGACQFYFMARENIKHLWPAKQLLGKPMLEQHVQEVVAMVMAGVRA